MKHQKIRMLCEAALMIAAATVLSLIKLWEMPWGGSIDLGMLPIFLFCFRWGWQWGFGTAFVYSLIQLMLGGSFVIAWQSLLGDYVLAFTLLGAAGFFKGKRGGVYWGTLLGGLLRFLSSYVTGATVWAEYMPEEFFGLSMTSPWFYSLLYNGFYMAIDIALCLAVFALLQKPLGKYLRGEDLTRK